MPMMNIKNGSNWYMDFMTKKPKIEIDEFGTIQYLLDGQLHREDGPAYIWRHGSQEWYQNGVIHRTDGPAYEAADGYVSWHLNGNEYEFEEWLEANDEIDDEDRTLLKLQYG